MADILCNIIECLEQKNIKTHRDGNRLFLDARSDNRKKYQLCAEVQPDENALIFTRFFGPLEEIERKSNRHKEAVHEYLKELLNRNNDGIYYHRDPNTGEIYIEAKLIANSSTFCKHFFDTCAGIATRREHLEDDLQIFLDL